MSNQNDPNGNDLEAEIDIRVLNLKVAQSEAEIRPEIPKRADGTQMAVGIGQMEHEGKPVLVVTCIVGEQQMSFTLDPSEADAFCNVLADGVLWQNQRLRERGELAVH